MSNPEHYRREAQRCRDLAASSPDPEAANRWRAIAADYDNLADAFSNPAPPIARVPMQQQPIQQQQSKTEPEDKKG
jgi:hypothetical protein